VGRETGPPAQFWHKSSYSMGNAQCVEVAHLAEVRIGVRDCKTADGPLLRFTPDAWSTFLKDVKRHKQT
jgi:hypothetical protein